MALLPSDPKPVTPQAPNPVPGIAPFDPTQVQPVNNAPQTPGIGMADQPQVNSLAPPSSPSPQAPVPPPPPAYATPPAPTSSAPGGAPQFGADSNLIGTQINPGATTAQAPNTNFGTGAISAGAPVSTADTARFDNYGGLQDSAVNDLSGGPNRTALALQQLSDYDTAGQPQLDADYRTVGQQAAKFGRLGAGMTTNDLTGVFGQYQRNKMLLKNDLARSVAEGDINDRFRKVSALSGLRGQESGFQNQRFGQDFANRGYNTGIDQYNQGAAFDRARAANDYQGDYQDRSFAQNRSNANDLRGERGFQYGLSQDAQNSAIQQKMLEDQLLNSSQGRALNQYNAGNADSPGSLYQNFANGQDATSAALFGNAGQLFGNMGQRTVPQGQQPDWGAILQQYLNSQGG